MRLLPNTAFSRNLLAAGAGTTIFFTASFFRNLVLARLLGPLDFGSWTLGLVCIQYGQWSHLSILNAFRLDGARARGRGDWPYLEKLRSLAFTACLFPALLVSAAAGGVAVAAGPGPFRNSLLLLATVLVPYQLYSLVNSSLSTMERFTVSARLQAGYAVVNLGLTIVLAWRFGFWGALVAQFVSYAATLAVFAPQLKIHLRPFVDVALAREQVAIGLPVALNGVVYSLFTTIDRTLTASLLGIAALGQYSLTALARSSIGLIPGAVSEVIYMRAANIYGEDPETDSLIPLVLTTDRLLAYIVALAVALGVIWVPIGVTVLLPSYRMGVPALQFFLVGMFFTFPVYAGVFLTVVGRAKELTVVYALATVIEAAMIAALIGRLGILGVAMATALASVVLFFSVNTLGLRRAGLDPGAVVLHLLDCALPLGIVFLAVGGAALARGALPAGGGAPYFEIVASALVLVAWAIVFRVRGLTRRSHSTRDEVPN